jgi:[ribosomal protein S5]-alanine N-acetyltransferase
MHRDAAVMATLGGPRSDERTREFLRRNLGHWTEHGFGLWLARSRSGQFVGRGGLRHVHVGGVAEIELAYALMPAFWGRGLATELATALLQIAFDQLAIAQVVAFTITTNVASRRVMEKLEGAFERELVHAGLPHVLYRWRAQSVLP